MPSISTSKGGTATPLGAFGIELAEIASSVAYRAAEASTSSPSRPSGPSIAVTSVGAAGAALDRVHKRRVDRDVVEQGLEGAGLVPLRVALRRVPLVSPPEVHHP